VVLCIYNDKFEHAENLVCFAFFGFVGSILPPKVSGLCSTGWNLQQQGIFFVAKGKGLDPGSQDL
jgi:hypothetical protein